MTELKVRIQKIIHAPIEKVFDAWLEPKMLAKFMLPMPGMTEPEVENDPREGGSFTIVMQSGDDKHPHTGKYIEIDRPNKLVFTWGSHKSLDDSTVTLSFKKIGDNLTQITLSHVKFINEKERSDHEAGWNEILNTLDDIMR